MGMPLRDPMRTSRRREMYYDRTGKMQGLIDRAEICEVLYNYATGADQKDEKLFRSIWTEEVTVDGVGGTYGESRPATLNADKWAAFSSASLNTR